MREILKRRIKEPSTWAGLGMLIPAILQAAATKDVHAIIAAVGGIAAVLLPESGEKK